MKTSLVGLLALPIAMACTSPQRRLDHEVAVNGRSAEAAHAQALEQARENSNQSCGGSVHGIVITGYIQPTSPHGVPCIPATKTCMNGSWVGPGVFAACSELP